MNKEMIQNAFNEMVRRSNDVYDFYHTGVSGITFIEYKNKIETLRKLYIDMIWGAYILEVIDNDLYEFSQKLMRENYSYKKYVR